MTEWLDVRLPDGRVVRVDRAEALAAARARLVAEEEAMCPDADTLGWFDRLALHDVRRRRD